MTKTYSEQRQHACFRAARELWKVACQVLDDVQNPVELKSIRTLEWAKSKAAYTARLAREIEDKGYAECIGSTRQQNLLFSAHSAYSDSVTAFQARVLEHGGEELLAAVNAFKTQYGSASYSH